MNQHEKNRIQVRRLLAMKAKVENRQESCIELYVAKYHGNADLTKLKNSIRHNAKIVSLIHRELSLPELCDIHEHTLPRQYKFVRWCSIRSKWVAITKVHGEQHYLGFFSDLIEALDEALRHNAESLPKAEFVPA